MFRKIKDYKRKLESLEKMLNEKNNLINNLLKENQKRKDENGDLRQELEELRIDIHNMRQREIKLKNVLKEQHYNSLNNLINKIKTIYETNKANR